MTEIAIRADQGAELQTYHDANLNRLQSWAEQASAVQQMAVVIVTTSMCPKAYRNKPDEATAAILAGIEMGLMPMASLRAFDDIQGTPAPKAITLRAVVQSRGHDLEVIEADTQHCIVEGRRKGSDRWQRLEWTIDRANQAGYPAKNSKWKTDPTAQLVARATAEMARWLDSAAIMGMPYSSEEIGDSTGLQAAAPTRLVTAADIVGQAVDHVQATVDAPTVDEILARIGVAETQDELDDIKQLCQTHGIRNGDIVNAWSLRSTALSHPGTDPAGV
jgi:hypothetical protein